jgi:hypothetical protein
MKSHLTNNIQSKASKMSVKSIHSTNNIFSIVIIFLLLYSPYHQLVIIMFPLKHLSCKVFNYMYYVFEGIK